MHMEVIRWTHVFVISLLQNGKLKLSLVAWKECVLWACWTLFLLKNLSLVHSSYSREIQPCHNFPLFVFSNSNMFKIRRDGEGKQSGSRSRQVVLSKKRKKTQRLGMFPSIWCLYVLAWWLCFVINSSCVAVNVCVCSGFMCMHFFYVQITIHFLKWSLNNSQKCNISPKGSAAS